MIRKVIELNTEYLLIIDEYPDEKEFNIIYKLYKQVALEVTDQNRVDKYHPSGETTK